MFDHHSSRLPAQLQEQICIRKAKTILTSKTASPKGNKIENMQKRVSSTHTKKLAKFLRHADYCCY